jgi:hypothetical protein
MSLIIKSPNKVSNKLQVLALMMAAGASMDLLTVKVRKAKKERRARKVKRVS